MSAGPDGAALAPPDPADVAAFARARERVLEVIETAAARAGRPATDITLVAVSKTVDAARVRAAVAAGLAILGENRVQEAAGKVDIVPGATWHLVGPLQANKARRAVEVFDVIETVDSPALAGRLDRIVREVRGLPADGPVAPADRLRVLLQVNVDADTAKAGYDPAVLERELDDLEELGALDLAGLMTVGRLVPTPAEARSTFVALRRISERLRARPGTNLGPEISMGMSGDYAVAVEEGATIVRVGTALFGERRPRGDVTSDARDDAGAEASAGRAAATGARRA
jgi:pyridoxal phosphate enzyme (YggS family)